ncbi:hypothetical protein ATY81_01150 [Rhizobium sp. R72]|nr:hypothetical protein ATY81_01150 [Rhizobium sp. R72]OWW05679.1 hypothetical protein ATY80_01150 [Rhizobium sp. R711]
MAQNAAIGGNGFVAPLVSKVGVSVIVPRRSSSKRILTLTPWAAETFGRDNFAMMACPDSSSGPCWLAHRQAPDAQVALQ